MATTKKPMPKVTAPAKKAAPKPKAPVTPKPRVSPLAKRPAAAREPEIVNPRTMSPRDKAAYIDRQKAYEQSQGLTVPKKKK